MSIIIGEPKSIIPAYFCPACATAYTTKEEAENCLVSTPTPELNVGDIVAIEHGYGKIWLPQVNKDWLDPRPGYKFHGENTLIFLFVVVGISDYKASRYPWRNNTDAHSNCYHVYSEAVRNGKPFKGLPEGVGGWTRADTHKSWKKPKEVPASVRARAAAIVKTGPHYGELL